MLLNYVIQVNINISKLKNKANGANISCCTDDISKITDAAIDIINDIEYCITENVNRGVDFLLNITEMATNFKAKLNQIVEAALLCGAFNDNIFETTQCLNAVSIANINPIKQSI